MSIKRTHAMENTPNKSILRNTLWILSSLITLPIFLLIIFIFGIYRQIINLILSIKYGSQYAGVLHVYDAVHAVKDAEKNPLCILFIIQYFRKSSQNFYDVAHRELYEKMFVKLRRNPKASAILRKSLGYPYLLKESVTSDDCLKKLQILSCPTGEIEKEDLIKFVSEYSSEPLPRNGEALWDMSIGTQTVRWRKDVPNDVVFYPILLRLHHIVSDGESIVKTLLGIFADKINIPKRQNAKEEESIPSGRKISFDKLIKDNINERKQSISDCLTQTHNQLKFYLQQLCLLCISPSLILAQLMRSRNDANALHGSPLSNQRVFAVKLEDAPCYIERIKRIKRRLPGCSFLDVMLTATSAAFNEYFVTNSVLVPDCVTVAIPESPQTEKLRALKPNNKLSEGHCSNMLSYTLSKLRINCSNTNVSLIERMQFIKELGSQFRNSLEFGAGHWVQTVVFGLLPACVVNFVMGLTEVTMIISNLPGPPSVSVFEGCRVQDIVPFGTHRERTGVILLIFTYDGRLQITLSVDKAFISEEREVQKILDDIYKFLDLLYAESRKLE